MFKRPIVIGLSPNLGVFDVLTAFVVLLSPWKWFGVHAIGRVEEWFRAYFNVSYASSFNSGRSALYAVLKNLGIGAGDEVLLQAFTCVAVPNSVLWTGARPVYVDIDDSLNFDPIDAARKISPKTKVLIVQHTFGNPADMDAVMSFAKKHNLLVIEDCAHALGARFKEKKLGLFGDAAIFSFGRDKVVSSVFGGIAITRQKELGEKLNVFQKSLSQSPLWWVIQQVLHPIITSISLPLYHIGIGKLILLISQKLHLLSFPVYKEEKLGQKPSFFPTQYSNVLAELLIPQLSRLAMFTQKRNEMVTIYKNELRAKSDTMPQIRDGAVLMRFPVFVSNPGEVLGKARKKGMVLGNWYRSCIDPKGVDNEKVFFDRETTPRAVFASEHIVNLPTYPYMNSDDAKSIVSFISNFSDSV